MWEEQLVDPPIHYITSVIEPESSVLKKPLNPEFFTNFQQYVEKQ